MTRSNTAAGGLCATALLLASTGCAAVGDGAQGSDSENAAQDVEVVAQAQALTNVDGSCNEEQWLAIEQANAGANWLVERAAEDFYTQEQSDLRHLWFGSYLERDINYKLLDLYQLTHEATSIRCDPPKSEACQAREGAYAYRDEQTIVFCDLYWTFDHNQGDYNRSVSQVGGLLHELTHLTVSQPGTSDWLGYGYIPARTAAVAGNGLAYTNADNWRFFLMQVPMDPEAEPYVMFP